MAKFGFGSILTFAVIVYIAHTLWTFYTLFHPPLCSSTNAADCLRPAFNPKSDKPSSAAFELRIYLTTTERPSQSDFNEKNEIVRLRALNLTESRTEVFEVQLPPKPRRNGTVWLHAFLLPPPTSDGDNTDGKSSISNPFDATWHLHQQCQITTFAIPQSRMIQLISSAKNDTATSKVSGKEKAGQSTMGAAKTNHWRSVLTLTAIPDPIAFEWNQIPGEIVPLMKLTQVESFHPSSGVVLKRKTEQRYLPIFYLDQLSFRVRDLEEIDRQTEKVNLTLHYRPVTLGKLRLLISAQHSMEGMKSYGFSEKDVDEVKGIFTDTNFYFLALTFVVAAVHLLLDGLAFKNDVSFWRERKTMVGVSTRTVIWRCFSQFVVFLYLMDEETSLLVLIPTSIGVVIEFWKVTKAFKVSFSFRQRPFITFGSSTNEERKTDEIDSQGMKYLGTLLVPLCLAGAVYSLIYVPHKSWYSWIIQSSANGVYAFGFLFMLPQLFVNYKLKSVAHLPWRAFMYKAFNTFIDDMFIFIITMPTAHRVACFRDDVVFLVYLYQRWLYPVDKSRINEYGESFDENEQNKKTQ